MDSSLARFGLLFLLVAALAASASAADKYTLSEPVTETRVFAVSSRFELSGKYQFSQQGGKATEQEAKATAEFRLRERRLPGSGRNAEALRSLRDYEHAESQVQVGDVKSSYRLRDRRRLIVAQGRREGASFHSPAGPMTRGETDLLSMPGDSLAALALLPLAPVSAGETWQADSWVVQMLTNVEAAHEAKLTCELESVGSDIARVKFAGTVKGAVLGAFTEISVGGHYLYDLKRQCLTRIASEHREKRSIGVASPGMEIVARVTVDRQPSADPGSLTDAAAERIPLEPPADLLMLTFQTPWNAQLTHDRQWHVYQQSGQVVVLRLLDRGNFIAQCNLAAVPAERPGRHTSERQFQADVEKVLGSQLKGIEKAEQIQSGDGRFLYRVTAAGEMQRPGEAAPTPVTWIYYLCAAPSGQQISLVFAVETKLLEQLGNRDLAMVKSLEFVTASPSTANAKP